MKNIMRTTLLGLLGALLSLALTSPANALVIFFSNDAGGFTAAMAGNTSLGTEDFEGSILAPNGVDGFDDPLTQGVSNSPDGFPYPTGLNLPMTVQSNVLGGASTSLSPQGLNGLAAASVGFLGAASDVVLSNTFVNSLDWIFSSSDNILGVGFDTLTFLGGSSVDVMVFDINNVFLGLQTIAADTVGTNFLGIQTTGGDFIGRINIFSTGNGAEGGDNAQLFSAAVTVPEPGTIALFGLGLAGFGFARRKKA